MNIHSGMNLREALAIAKDMGCLVITDRGDGEVRISHPLMVRPIRLNNRRKDAARVLTKALAQLARISRPGA